MPPYGQMFNPGEVILVHLKNEPSFFARSENVIPDRKKGWWQISLLILTMPLKKMTWILDDEQMRGADFTMGGMPIRMERIEFPFQDKKDAADSGESSQGDNEGRARIVSLFDDEDGE
jgi:hypothetical protein